MLCTVVGSLLGPLLVSLFIASLFRMFGTFGFILTVFLGNLIFCMFGASISFMVETPAGTFFGPMVTSLVVASVCFSFSAKIESCDV